MATLTTNYQLKKPAASDSVSIADINNNMDIIDTQIKANADLISNMVPKAGGTMTGNLTVGSASIGTNGYIQATWIRTTASIHLGSTPADYPVLSGGWIYSRTAAEMKSDLGIDAKLNQSGGTMTGALVAQTNTNYSTAQLRNVIISTSDPSGGSSGDIWIKYA